MNPPNKLSQEQETESMLLPATYVNNFTVALTYPMVRLTLGETGPGGKINNRAAFMMQVQDVVVLMELLGAIMLASAAQNAQAASGSLQ